MTKDELKALKKVAKLSGYKLTYRNRDEKLYVKLDKIEKSANNPQDMNALFHALFGEGYMTSYGMFGGGTYRVK